MRLEALIFQVLGLAALGAAPLLRTSAAPAARLAAQPPTATPASGGAETQLSPLFLPLVRRGIWYDGAVTFAVIGDYGVCAIGGPETCASETRVAELVKSWDPQFIVTAGDNNYPRGKWDTWAVNSAPYREFIPDRFEPAVGNHDYICSMCPDLAFRTYFQRELTRQFAKPHETNPLLRFYMFDSNEADPDSRDGVSAKAAKRNSLGPQRTWLEQGLKGISACWKLVVMHHPPYSSTSDPGSNKLLQSRSGWSYRQWGADVVLSGHAHDYERITRPGGFAYIVNGAGGAPRDPLPTAGVTGSVTRIADAFGAIRGYADPAKLVLEFYTIDVEAPAAAPQLRDVHRLTRDCNAPSG